MKILGDQPIRDKTEDALNRVAFAEHIASGILKWISKESLCIALYGPWGSGKTSIINLCLNSIKEKTKELDLQNQPVIIRFQPWLISGQEELINSFLHQLRNALKKPNLSEYAHKAAKQLEVYEKLVGFLTWVPKVSGYAQKMKDFLAKLKGTAQTLSRQIDEDLESNKESICNALIELQSPIIIVIDDIDRLTSHEIRQIFQLIKAVADFPNTIYLLAFDRKSIEKALEPFQAGDETNYLEKIVQLAFEVPNPSRNQIEAVLWNGLDAIIGSISSQEDELGRWNELRFGPLPKLLRNVRDVKRYLNAVNFTYPIIKGEVSTVDLLIVEAVHIFSPLVYRAVRNNKDYLLSDSPLAIISRADDEKKIEFINNLEQLAPDGLRNEIKEMFSLLFPEVESVFEKHGWGNGFLDRWDKNQRMCISSYFDYYFQGSLPEGEVSAEETRRVIELLSNQRNLTLVLKNYVSDGRIGKLLHRIESHIEDNVDERLIQNLIASLFESGESLPLKPFSFEDSPDRIIQGVIYRSLKRIDLSARKKVLLNAINSSKNAILFAVAVVDYVWIEWNPIDEKQKGKTEEEKLLSEEDVTEVKDVARALLRRLRDSEILYKTRHLISVLYSWERWSGIEEVKEWVETILSDEKKIPDFLGGCGGFVASWSNGSHYQTHKFRISSKDLVRFCDIEELRKKCEGTLSSAPKWLLDDHKVIIKAFLDGLDKKDSWNDE